MEFFTSEKISPSTTKLVDVSGVAVFLVEGAEKAVLIDTATGAGDLKSYVAALTDKPVEVILTHGHSDHAGGAAGFDKVWLHEDDWDLVKHHATMDMKMDYVRFITGKELSPKNFVPERTAGYLAIKNGQEFDLGGLTLKMLHVPGHTHGTVCVLLAEERTILFGDACNNAVFLWDEEACCVEEYRQSLLELKKQENSWDTVWLSHGPTAVDRKVLDGVISVCDEILAGTNDWQPYEFMGQSLRMAKKVKDRVRLDGGLGNIVYHPKKVFTSGGCDEGISLGNGRLCDQACG